MEIVPSLTVSSETGLGVRLQTNLRYGKIQLTGKLDIAVGIVNEAFCDLGWKGRNGCKCHSKKHESLIMHHLGCSIFRVKKRKEGITME